MFNICNSSNSLKNYAVLSKNGFYLSILIWNNTVWYNSNLIRFFNLDYFIKIVKKFIFLDSNPSLKKWL